MTITIPNITINNSNGFKESIEKLVANDPRRINGNLSESQLVSLTF